MWRYIFRKLPKQLPKPARSLFEAVPAAASRLPRPIASISVFKTNFIEPKPAAKKYTFFHTPHSLTARVSDVSNAVIFTTQARHTGEKNMLTLEDLMQKKLVFKKTSSAEYLYEAEYKNLQNGETTMLVVRLNDFPLEELYTLMQKTSQGLQPLPQGNFSDWPPLWENPDYPNTPNDNVSPCKNCS